MGNQLQVPMFRVRNTEENVVGEEDAEAQTEYNWSNIEKVLPEAGSDLDEIVEKFVFAVGAKSFNRALDVRKLVILGKDPLAIRHFDSRLGDIPAQSVAGN